MEKRKNEHKEGTSDSVGLQRSEVFSASFLSLSLNYMTINRDASTMNINQHTVLPPSKTINKSASFNTGGLPVQR